MEKSFEFIFLYSKSGYSFDLEILRERVKKLSELVNIKIVMNEVEIEEISRDCEKVKDPKMICFNRLGAPFLEKLLERFPKIKWVHFLSAGVDKLLKDTQLKNNPEIILTNGRGAYSDALAEYSILSILYFNYHIPQYFTAFQNKEWKPIIDNQLVNKKVICIFGYGKNGIAIAKRVKYAFNMYVIGVIRKMREDIEGKEFCDEFYEFSQINEGFFSKCDFVIATLPQTPQTINLFDKKFFEKMKKNSVFINIGRGSAVVEADLYEALAAGKIRGAVLDVTKKEPLEKDSKLYTLTKDKLLITNHTGDRTDMFELQSCEVLLKNLESFLTKNKLETVVRKELGY